MKYKEKLKRKGSKDSDRASISKNSDQVGIIKEADKNSSDVLTTE